MKTQAPDPTKLPPEVNREVPSIARVCDYFMGGKDNFPADRAAASAVEQVFPQGKQLGKESRFMLQRATRFLVQNGIKQFLDIGSGLPTAGNVHEIAHETDPEVRVVYVDNDPIVLAHARALLADNQTTTVIQADLRHPDGIFEHPDTLRLLDFDQPVAVFMASILHHLDDEDDPWAIAAQIRDRLPSGSYVMITHFYDSGDERARDVEAALVKGGLGSGWFRTADQIARFFDGMELLEPGVAAANDWRPDDHTPRGSDTHHLLAGALGRTT
ncbi:SAM-dependent methyltransferase [Nocardiopsis ansamitocini]|uniref:SAM-dependent methyltransferase n=1 Tax=Nocardiopsis ansamitocini TaxID=1670832 RepID=A0A9W6P7J7_9ACTN|nr:SAM-dependent methyltransferase [Nocardiopsis ansamitocini]GLU48630.1 SAM-dependent methyltransferase [Nocardiopsis ansamitocini]